MLTQRRLNALGQTPAGSSLRKYEALGALFGGLYGAAALGLQFSKDEDLRRVGAVMLALGALTGSIYAAIRIMAAE